MLRGVACTAARASRNECACRGQQAPAAVCLLRVVCWQAVFVLQVAGGFAGGPRELRSRAVLTAVLGVHAAQVATRWSRGCSRPCGCLWTRSCPALQP